MGKHGGDETEKESMHSWHAEDGFAEDGSRKPKSRRLQALKEAIKKRVEKVGQNKADQQVRDLCDLKFIIEDELVLQSKGKKLSQGIRKRSLKLADSLVDEISDSQFDKLRDANAVNQAVANKFARFPVLMRPILINRQLEGKIPFDLNTSRDSMKASLKECTGREILLTAEMAADVRGTVGIVDPEDEQSQKIQGAFYNISHLNSLIEQSYGTMMMMDDDMDDTTWMDWTGFNTAIPPDVAKVRKRTAYVPPRVPQRKDSDIGGMIAHDLEYKRLTGNKFEQARARAFEAKGRKLNQEYPPARATRACRPKPPPGSQFQKDTKMPNAIMERQNLGRKAAKPPEPRPQKPQVFHARVPVNIVNGIETKGGYQKCRDGTWKPPGECKP